MHVPIENYMGDIRKLEDITEAVNGTDFVIHCCALVDVTCFPDKQNLYDTNVVGKTDSTVYKTHETYTAKYKIAENNIIVV